MIQEKDLKIAIEQHDNPLDLFNEKENTFFEDIESIKETEHSFHAYKLFREALKKNGIEYDNLNITYGETVGEEAYFLLDMAVLFDRTHKKIMELTEKEVALAQIKLNNLNKDQEA